MMGKAPGELGSSMAPPYTHGAFRETEALGGRHIGVGWDSEALCCVSWAQQRKNLLSRGPQREDEGAVFYWGSGTRRGQPELSH